MTETFLATQQVEDLTRPRLASQPEPSVAWCGGDPGCEAYTGSLAGRVIEPRNSRDRGSRRRDVCGRQHRGAGTGRALPVPPGSESGACRRWVAQEPGRSRRLHRRRGTRTAAIQMRPGPGGGPLPREANASAARTGHTRGTAKRRQRSAAGWAARSRSSLILPLKSGNRPHGTRRREAADRIMGCRADRRHGHRATSRLNASPAASGESSETAARGCAPAQRCHGPRSRMPELGTFGSVGAGGGQPPSATRPHSGLLQGSFLAARRPATRLRW